MKMTTNNTLPLQVREKYELVKPLRGGPRYAFPAHGGIVVDFSKIDERTAEYLVRQKWPGIRRVEKKESKTATADDKPGKKQ